MYINVVLSPHLTDVIKVSSKEHLSVGTIPAGQIHDCSLLDDVQVQSGYRHVWHAGTDSRDSRAWSQQNQPLHLPC